MEPFYRKKERVFERIYDTIDTLPKGEARAALMKHFNLLTLYTIEEHGGVKKALRKLDDAALKTSTNLKAREDIVETRELLTYFCIKGKGNFASAERNKLSKEYKANIFYEESREKK